MDPSLPLRPEHATLEALLSEREWLVRLSSRLVQDDATARDLAQETLLATIRRPPASSETPRAFLATVLRRVVARFHRAGDRRRARESRVAVSEGLPDAEQLASEAEARRAVVDAVMELDEPYRRTILLRFFRGVPAAVIAKEEGVTAAAIDTRVFRALSTLRSRLDARFGERTRWSAPLLSAAQSWTNVGVSSALVQGSLVMNVVGKSVAATVLLVAVVAVLRSDHVEHEPTFESGSTVRTAAPIDTRSEGPDAAPGVEREVTRTIEPDDRSRAIARVAVVDAEGAPVPFARLLLDRDGRIEQHEADEAGNAEVETQDRVTVVAVTSSAYAPQRIERVLTAGDHRIELERGSEISGFVRENGARPGSSVRVFLDYTSVSTFEWSRDIRAVTAEGFDFLECWSEADGAFRFRGLPKDVYGDLRVDENRHRLRSDFAARSVRAPTSGVILEVEPHPRVTGRVVDSKGTPIDEAQVSVGYGPADREPVASRIEFTDSDGRFEHWLPIEDAALATSPWRVAVRIVARDAVREAERSSALDVGGVVDLGEIVLEDPVATRFRAVDEVGQPLEGVVGIGRALRGTASSPTDEGGHGMLWVGTPRDRVYFAAVGREVVAMDVVRGESTTVSLPRAAALEVSMRRTDGTRPAIAWVEIEALGTSPFAIPEGESPIAFLSVMPEAFREAMSHGLVVEGDLHRTRYEIHDGVGSMKRLKPGVAFDVRISTETTPGVEVRRGVVLAPGETAVLEVSNLPKANPLAIRVLTVDREPILRAVVDLIGADGSPSATRFVDAAGTVVFPEVEGDKAEVTIHAPGFASKQVEFDRLTDAAGRPFEVELDPGRRVELRVVDRGGRPIEALIEVVATAGTEASDSEAISFERGFTDGRYVFEALPPNGPIRFSARIGGTTYSLIHDSPVNEAKLIVPEHGSLVVEYDFPLATNYVPTLRLVESRSGEVVEIEFPEFSRRPDRVVFPYVPVGRYSVNVRSAPDDDEGADRNLGEIDGIVELLAGRESHATLRRP